MGLDKELYHHSVPMKKNTGFNEVRIFRVSMIPYSQISNPHPASLSHNVGDVSHCFGCPKTWHTFCRKNISMAIWGKLTLFSDRTNLMLLVIYVYI